MLGCGNIGPFTSRLLDLADFPIPLSLLLNYKFRVNSQGIFENVLKLI
jgi:hypothetical protein